MILFSQNASDHDNQNLNEMTMAMASVTVDQETNSTGPVKNS